MKQPLETMMRPMQLECNRAALFALKDNPKGVKYSTRAWVPDEYDSLERMGLVHCEFGFADPVSPMLRERTITLTEQGKVMLNLLQPVDGLEKLRIRYSFKDALRDRDEKAVKISSGEACASTAV